MTPAELDKMARKVGARPLRSEHEPSRQMRVYDFPTAAGPATLSIRRVNAGYAQPSHMVTLRFRWPADAIARAPADWGIDPSGVHTRVHHSARWMAEELAYFREGRRVAPGAAARSSISAGGIFMFVLGMLLVVIRTIVQQSGKR